MLSIESSKQGNRHIQLVRWFPGYLEAADVLPVLGIDRPAGLIYVITVRPPETLYLREDDGQLNAQRKGKEKA